MDIAKLMKQAQDVQQKMQAVQNELAKKEYVGSAGGDMVKVTLLGSGMAKKVEINDSLLSDKTILEDLVVAAINDAKKKIDSDSADTISKIAGGIKLPAGFNM